MIKKLRGCASVFAIFFFGAIVGGVIVDAGARQKYREIVEGGPDKVVDVVVYRLNEELKLDGSQKRLMEDIVAKTKITLRQTRDQVRPQVRQTLGEAEVEIRKLLYENQVKKFDEIVRKGREKWEKDEVDKAGQ